jgi:hypothetical protein
MRIAASTNALALGTRVKIDAHAMTSTLGMAA